MSNIIQADPYESLYEESAPVVPFKKADVEAVNYLVKISQGKREKVETVGDWGIVAKIFEFWTRRWPEEWVEFLEQIKAIRQTRANKEGMSQTREIKYVGALPIRFQKMVKIIFPLQQFNKEFVNKLTNNIKVIKVGEKTDTWFTIPEAPLKRKTTNEIVDEAVKKVKKDE